MKNHLLVLALFMAAVSLTASADMPAGGFAGTWKANFAKSKFPGKPPQVDMATVDPDGTVTVNEVSPEGKKITWHYTPVEGQAVPIVGRDNTTVLVKKVDDHTNEQTWNSNGKINKSKAVLSKDGKTTTFTMDGTDKDGKPFHELVVYDKE
ncbi:MAG TPA: hypothetical protein VFA74_20775 [Terriglobales bacterium]|nr:hypothetical protein [Terriglobales bacterium]